MNREGNEEINSNQKKKEDLVGLRPDPNFIEANNNSGNPNQGMSLQQQLSQNPGGGGGNFGYVPQKQNNSHGSQLPTNKQIKAAQLQQQQQQHQQKQQGHTGQQFNNNLQNNHNSNMATQPNILNLLNKQFPGQVTQGGMGMGHHQQPQQHHFNQGHVGNIHQNMNLNNGQDNS